MSFFGNRQAECLGYTKIPQWFHIRSEDNIADLGTKMNARVEDINEDSNWQNGHPWMRRPREEWPITQKVSDAEVPKEALLVAKGICNAIKVKHSTDAILQTIRKFVCRTSLLKSNCSLFIMHR